MGDIKERKCNANTGICSNTLAELLLNQRNAINSKKNLFNKASKKLTNNTTDLKLTRRNNVKVPKIPINAETSRSFPHFNKIPRIVNRKRGQNHDYELTEDGLEHEIDNSSRIGELNNSANPSLLKQRTSMINTGSDALERRQLRSTDMNQEKRSSITRGEKTGRIGSITKEKNCKLFRPVDESNNNDDLSVSPRSKENFPGLSVNISRIPRFTDSSSKFLGPIRDEEYEQDGIKASQVLLEQWTEHLPAYLKFNRLSGLDLRHTDCLASMVSSVSTVSDFDPDFDGYFKQAETYDLSTFDFGHMTKPLPKKERLSHNKEDYLEYCEMFNVLPTGYILRNLTSSELRLRGYSLGSTRIKALCSALVLNSTVSTLEISEDKIDVHTMQFLVETFQDNSTVQQLILQDNNMGRAPVKLLLEYVTTSDQLSFLSLAGNRLTDRDGDIITSYILATQNLSVLDLSYNQLEREAAELLGKALVKNTSISTLSLRWNHMGGEALKLFLSCLKKNLTLSSLDLSWNGFNNEAVKTLCKGLRVNNVLTTLDISSCRIKGEQLLQIVVALKKNAGLRSLYIGNNVFACQNIQDALQGLLNVKGELVLRELDMADTALSDEANLLVQKLMEEKDIMVYHGSILGRHERELTDADLLALFNPATILIEFGNLLGMTIEQLFDYMDEDKSGTMTMDEIKSGLYKFDIPLPEHSLDLLIRKMDYDGDGAISLSELMIHKDKRTVRTPIANAINAKESTFSAVHWENEGSRCRKVLKRMMVKQEAVKSEDGESKTGEENAGMAD